jgi:TonB-linked SusC/RagA family outer membrane protein
MKPNYLLIVFLIFSTMCFAQSYDIGGIVKEAKTGIPIPGVNIQIKNETKGTSSDIDGKFTLNKVPSGSLVVFSYVGYASVEYKVNSDNKNVSITLENESKSLNEVVVIGYGAQKKREVTGAVATVSSKTLGTLNPVKIEQALQGTVAGVNVTTTSGAPGAALDIRIRGIATNGENRPAVIIDGYVGELATLNPADVETITVLKDAQAAIYGTIAANGIILITTKSGKKNSKAKISYNNYTGFQETTRTLPVLDATEYALLLNESYANGGKPLPYPNASGLGEGTNWQNEIFSTGVPIISHDLSVSGGSDKITYSVSGSFLDQEGIVGGDKSAFARNTARISLGFEISDKFNFKTNSIYTYQNRTSLNDSGLGSVLFNALNVPATLSPYDANGNYTLVPSTAGLGIEIINPLAQIANTYNDYIFNKLNGNFVLDYKPMKDLVFTAMLGYNKQNGQSRVFLPEISYGGKVFDNTRSEVNQSAVFDNNYSFDLYGTYTKKFGENNLVGTLGTTIFKEFGNGLFATGYDVPYNSWDYADIGLANGISETKTNGSYSYDERRLSYFARVQYDYKGKYLLSAMFRSDTSSKFGTENRTAYFPSMTAGWIISDEGFYGENKLVNFLKLRGSYGVLGNDQIPNNGYVSFLTGEAEYVFDGQLVSGLATGQIPNPNLKWEEARKFDAGLDMKMFQSKINIIADYFIDTRADLLIPYVPVSGINGTAAPGAASPTINAGTVRNSGFEFAIDYKNKFSDNFSLSLGYNVTFIDNEVIEVNNGTGYIEGGAFGVGQPYPSRMQEGFPMGYFYGYQTNGIFQNQQEVDDAASQLALGANAQAGDIRYVDVNGDGVINTDDRTNLGDPIADATMGFNLQMNYKNIDFVVYTYASVGNDMVRNYERTLSDVNHLDYVLGRWTGEGTSSTVPRVTTAATANNVFSSYYVEDASFVRIQNVQIGYTFNQNFLDATGISKLRLYMGVNNLYTFTKYMGYDPGASSGQPIGSGIDYGFYPIPRTYMLGLNLNF